MRLVQSPASLAGKEDRSIMRGIIIQVRSSGQALFSAVRKCSQKVNEGYGNCSSTRMMPMRSDGHRGLGTSVGVIGMRRVWQSSRWISRTFRRGLWPDFREKIGNPTKE